MPPTAKKADQDPMDVAPAGALVTHTVVAMPPSGASSEQPGVDQDNTMVIQGEFGARSYVWPTSADEALMAHVEHGAVPLHPERWPWKGDTLVPLPPHASEFCDTPDVCFPNGLAVGTTAATCVHGSHEFGS